MKEERCFFFDGDNALFSGNLQSSRSRSGELCYFCVELKTASFYHIPVGLYRFQMDFFDFFSQKKPGDGQTGESRFPAGKANGRTKRRRADRHLFVSWFLGCKKGAGWPERPALRPLSPIFGPPRRRLLRTPALRPGHARRQGAAAKLLARAGAETAGGPARVCSRDLGHRRCGSSFSENRGGKRPLFPLCAGAVAENAFSLCPGPRRF